MALLNPQPHCQIRYSNKEPEWSSICNNVFDEYLDTNDLFGLEQGQHERNSSNDSLNLFDFSGSSEQSHETEATSTHSWEHTTQDHNRVARQPKAKESLNFWTKKLRDLEQNAAESERKVQRLRSTKSHPDFLSLGGYPTPPAIPSSRTDQAVLSQQRLPRAALQNERRRNITARSVSRGRPTGVLKSAVAGSVNPNATIRKRSASPSKMMNPSRYRAGFQDAWLERAERNSKKYELRSPPSPLFCTPPPCDIALQQFNPLVPTGPMAAIFDEHISPLTNTFQRTHIHTPTTPPTVNYTTQYSPSFFEPVPPLPPNIQSARVTSSNDTAPLYPERTASLAASRIQSFDFGFPDTTSNYTSWTSNAQLQPAAPMYPTDQFSSPDPFDSLNIGVLPTTETFDLSTVGLGISCDPALVSSIAPLDTSILPAEIYLPPKPDTPPFHFSTTRPNGLPSTPHRRFRSYRRSQSPSPPATEPRSSKKATSARRSSRHRRTKSTNSTPRHPHSPDKGAFVNFTANDSNKILSGVAPSGSSKTKARREKEAADKRRRFSQAAVRAVVEAGGDLDALSKAGLLA